MTRKLIPQLSYEEMRRATKAMRKSSSAGNPEAPVPDLTTPLENVRVKIAWAIGLAFLGVIILAILVMWHLTSILKVDEEMAKANPELASSFDRAALAGTLHVALAMYFGFTSIFFGFAMTWVGIEAAFNVAGQHKTADGSLGRLSFTSSAPGLLFAALGTFLVAFAINKQLVFEERGGQPYRRGKTEINEVHQDNSDKTEKGSGTTTSGFQPQPFDQSLPQ